MAHPDDLYRAVDDSMPGASTNEVKEEYQRVVSKLAEGAIDARELQEEYGIHPNEVDGYDVDQSRSEESMAEVVEQPVLEADDQDLNGRQLEQEEAEPAGTFEESGEYRDIEREFDMRN